MSTASDSRSDREEDDMPVLSAEAQAALQEFYAEQAAVQQQELDTNQQPQEDWELSQFWYSEETATKLAEEVIRAINGRGRVACVSCPTLYIKLMDVKPVSVEAHLLEFDSRFAKYANFVHYDYKTPCALPDHLSGSFDMVVVDPPFLSEECLVKTALTVRHLMNSTTAAKVLLCTGAKQQELAERLLNVRKTDFTIHHSKNLMNDFACFASYETSFSS